LKIRGDSDLINFLNVEFQADLTPLFNWNVKQLFLYLTAEYTTPHNEVIATMTLYGSVSQPNKCAASSKRLRTTALWGYDHLGFDFIAAISKSYLHGISAHMIS
jgi:hypothetical protein